MRFPRSLAVALAFLATDGCTAFEWWGMVAAQEDLEECRKAHSEPSSCKSQETEAEASKADYEDAVVKSGCSGNPDDSQWRTRF